MSAGRNAAAARELSRVMVEQGDGGGRIWVC